MKTTYKTALILILFQLHVNSQSIDSCQALKHQFDNYYKTNTLLFTSFGLFTLIASFCMYDMLTSSTWVIIPEYKNSTSIKADKAVLISYAIFFYPMLAATIYRGNKISKLKTRLKACNNSLTLNIDF
jgi:hypothetical protein